MPRIDAIATEGHFVDHITPVWLAIPEEHRGTFYIRSHIGERAIPGAVRGDPPKSGRPTLVASAGDLKRSYNLGRPTAIMEHGCGQSFGGGPKPKNHSSYAGGLGRPAQLFLHPGPHPAARDHAQYPDARIEVVGCPKLDSLPRKPERDAKPVVAIAFHWDCKICMETRWALVDPGFQRAVPALAAMQDWTVIGHGHPRARERFARWFARQGVEFVATFEEVCRRADVYVNDASSTLFEFASTGRPVVAMNASCYRKSINHGLRFWEAATVGVQVGPNDDMIAAVRKALADSSAQQKAREKALDLVYAYRDGAAERAAAVLMDWGV
jgi:hypothetical protein